MYWYQSVRINSLVGILHEVLYSYINLVSCSSTVHVLLYRYILILYWICRSLAVVVDWLLAACWLHDWLLAWNWFARICMVVCRPHTAQQTPCSSDISDSGRTCAVEFMHVRDFSYLSGFSSVFLFVWIFLSVFHLSGFSSVFYFLFNFVCDFPQCFISFVWNFSFCLRADSNPRALEYQANSLTIALVATPGP